MGTNYYATFSDNASTTSCTSKAKYGTIKNSGYTSFRRRKKESEKKSMGMNIGDREKDAAIILCILILLSLIICAMNAELFLYYNKI